MLAILEDHAKATIGWLKLAKAINTYFSKSARTTWRKGFTPQMWAVELGRQWTLRNFMAEAWFADYTLVFAKPIAQTSSDTIQSIFALQFSGAAVVSH